MKEAIYDNLSVRSDFKSARSVLIIITGPPMEITMDGFFGCITTLEDLAPMAEVRWGDFPIPKSKYLSVVVMFSGIKGLSLEDFA
jgi:cell division GTPase FtsZ